MYCTVELGLGQDAPTDRKTILPIADIKGRDGRMVGHLAEKKKRETLEQQSEKRRCEITSGTFYAKYFTQGANRVLCIYTS